ncbi:MAG TPA: hypothetical protein VMW51_09420 [Terriglobia bacterium]|nr:hypothetical protein [Terriglobia bacterium]
MRTTFPVKCSFVIAILLALALPLQADTIYQAAAQGRRRVIQSNAILVSQDSSILVYKHFDLPDMRVEKVQLSEGSLPYTVITSSPQQRQSIVDLWKRFGYTALVTDTSGKATQVFDAYIDFYPPGGRGSLLIAVGALTSFPLQLDSGGADVADFSKIARVEFQNGEITLTLRNGRVEHGKFLMPTSKPAEARFLGITSKYNPASEDVFDFSEPLSHLKSIVFQP